ncbi:MAG: hypothetical protein QM489_00820 [Candidatus Izemoplasma sp.]
MVSLQPFINEILDDVTKKRMSDSVQKVFDKYATPDVSVVAVETKVDLDKRVSFTAQVSVRTNIHL